MSQVLVSPPSMPLATPLMEAMECSSSQQQIHLNAPNLADVASIEEKRMASQLAYLASQHHTSEYNRLKFGPGGAPVMYIPLSIQVSAHVRELKARQAQNSHKRAWWPANAPGETRSDPMDVDLDRNHVQKYASEPFQQENVVPYPPLAYTTGPELQDPAHHSKPAPPLNHPPTLNLQRELSAAMSSPLSIITIPQLSRVAYHQPNLSLYAKTSESHPINISPIVPFELLPLITSHLAPTPHASHMFDLPPSLLLHHLIAHSTTTLSDVVRSYPLMRVTNGSLPFPMNGVGPPPPDQPPIHSYGMPEPRFIAPENPILMQNRQAQKSNTWLQSFGNSESTAQPVNLPRSGSDRQKHPGAPTYSPLSLPSTQSRPQSAPPALLSSHFALPENIANGVATSPPPLPEVIRAMSSDILTNANNGRDPEKDAESVMGGITPPDTWAVNVEPEFVPPLRPALGNILLSSCPGKKVRLSGPVKGRGAICRDLGHDLRRVRALGVGCIICCLDDEELEFLGASWPQYSEIARSVGLDVLRIPIPEGLTPTTPALFDQHLSYIIHSYTLQGIPVLVHCRGGVGRAGLVACCWMLKLGLCGWLNPTHDETTLVHVHADERGNDDVGELVKVRRETLELVERVITVVRRRRSVKAIETYEQVRFLVDFVEHLRGGASSRA